MTVVSKEIVNQIVVEFLKKQKNMDKIDVSFIEKRDDMWIIRGTCPIDLEGHPWAEKFEIIVNDNGKIKSTDFSLL